MTSTRPTTIKHRFLGGVPGFVLVHTPSGHTSYGLIYRANGQRKKLTLGTTKMLTLAEARMLASKYRADIEGGADPHGERIAKRRQNEDARQQTEEKQQLDVEAMWKKYIQIAAAKLRSKGEKERIFQRYILPTVRGRGVAEITKRHVLEAIDKLIAQDKRRMADKVRQEGAAFFQWLIEREHVDRNVFAGIRKASPGKVVRTRVLSDDEVNAVWAASEPEGRWSLWIKLLILTGCRNMEVRNASWSEFDIDAKVWTIPAERSKNGRPHTIFLTEPILELLKAVPRFKNVDLLFPAVGNMMRPMSGDQKVKDRIDKRMRAALQKTGGKEPENWCVHDFRRTIATGLQRLGFRPDIADQVIGHVGSTRVGAAAHYLHYAYDDERLEALTVWSQHVLKICTGSEKPKSLGAQPIPRPLQAARARLSANKTVAIARRERCGIAQEKSMEGTTI